MRPFLIALAMVATVLPLRAAPPERETLKTDTGLTYSAWLPKDFATRRHDVPLILFSHGFGGCAQQSSTLTQALADAGYAVLAPNHKDQGCERYITSGWLGAAWAAMTGKGPDKSFSDHAAWDATTEVSRRDDMNALLAYALHDARYKDAIDPSHIALMGHSLGGYTVLGMAGGWSEWRDPRVKAVLALAPFSTPFLDKATLGQIKAPVMYQVGTKDSLVGPELVAQSYAQTKAPRYFVVLERASHYAFTELDQDYQTTIAKYAIGFFDRELLHKPAPVLDQPSGSAARSQVARFEHHR